MQADESLAERTTRHGRSHAAVVDAGPDRRPDRRANQRLGADIALGALWLLFAAFVIGLSTHGASYEPLVDGWLGSLTTVLPALAVLASAPGYRGAARAELLLLGGGALAWSLGGVYFVVASGSGWSLPFPSVGDVGFLLFPLLAFLAIASRVHRQAGDVQRIVWLDAAVAALGAATAVAVPLGPLVSGASGDPLSVAVAAAYPLSDLVLAAIVAGVVVAFGFRPGASWWWLLAGMFAFTVSDVVYALRVANDAYSLGTPVDAGWSLGLLLIATGTRRRGSWSQQPLTGARTVTGRTALLVPALAMLTAMAVLVAGRWITISPIAVALAALTLLAIAIRTQIAFRQVLALDHLGRQARTDPLTGLGNRRALYEHLEARLHPRDPGRESLSGAGDGRLAVLLLDLDRFKEINDTLGHQVGDALLRLIGPRMADALRPEDLIVRLGGDEFAIVVPLATGQRPEEIAERLLGQLAEPLNLDGVPLRISASIGVALYPDHARDANGLLQRADVAMYAAKAGGGGVRRYHPERDQHSRERLRTVEELRVALATEQLTVHYQPQCEVATGSVRGMEALVRWNHPARGQLPPDLFITIAEQTGLMRALTSYVLTQAVRQCHQWRLDGLEVGVSVNLSASSLLDQQLPEQVSWLLASHDLPAHALTLELTENTLMSDATRCKATLVRLKELGVGLAIDDYGTGYCSLSYLQELPVDELKLDRAFLSDVRDPRNGAIVRSTIDLAHALGMRLVAEGVEDQTTLDHLSYLGCDTVQGYHLSRPLPAPEATSWLRKRSGTGHTPGLPTTFSR